MQLGLCGSSDNSNNRQSNIFFVQTETPLAIPFGEGTETTVLTVPVQVTSNLQPVLINGLVQIQGLIPQATPSYQYGVTMRIRHNGSLLFTQALQLGGNPPANIAHSNINSIPISLVHNNTSLATNTYTVTLTYSLRSVTGITITAQSRSLNVLTI
ncbi:hypothetical protein [Ureibacillus sinduriensis]|uniref:Uncharacterized protein n=1 Tax=Ureibacillus sinduriensis BLB-1 = JCM 15800 TaxID=1384057 RepID=A0A0A3HYI0_9BACL|nr:hypothetical protein [Ureibacillus sinduriensis]KGR76275.1 hypothetical protein CD33_06935 [Ureibacillus sinduriensis BLB-1 = JCM 15800]